MRLAHMQREWIEVERADGSVVKFMALGLGDGRLHIGADNLSIKPDGDNQVILLNTVKEQEDGRAKS